MFITMQNVKQNYRNGGGVKEFLARLHGVHLGTRSYSFENAFESHVVNSCKQDAYVSGNTHNKTFIQSCIWHVDPFKHMLICSIVSLPKTSEGTLLDLRFISCRLVCAHTVTISDLTHITLWHQRNVPETWKLPFKNSFYLYTADSVRKAVSPSRTTPSRKHAYIILTPLNPTFI